MDDSDASDLETWETTPSLVKLKLNAEAFLHKDAHSARNPTSIVMGLF